MIQVFHALEDNALKKSHGNQGLSQACLDVLKLVNANYQSRIFGFRDMLVRALTSSAVAMWKSEFLSPLGSAMGQTMASEGLKLWENFFKENSKQEKAHTGEEKKEEAKTEAEKPKPSEKHKPKGKKLMTNQSALRNQKTQTSQNLSKRKAGLLRQKTG